MRCTCSSLFLSSSSSLSLSLSPLLTATPSPLHYSQKRGTHYTLQSLTAAKLSSVLRYTNTTGDLEPPRISVPSPRLLRLEIFSPHELSMCLSGETKTSSCWLSRVARRETQLCRPYVFLWSQRISLLS